MVRNGHRFEIRREGSRCAALSEDAAGAFSCTIYENRPASLPRVRRRRAALPRGTPARRSERRRALVRAHARDDRSVRAARRDRRSARPAGRARARMASRGGRPTLRVVRRSLDARKGRPLGHRLRLLVARTGRGARAGAAAGRADRPRWPAGRPAPRVVVVGSGPAGSWAALRLAEAGRARHHRRAGQAGAAAAPRPRPAHARPAGAALELLLRRGRRGNVLRRKALHPRQGSRRASRTSSRIWCASARPAEIAIDSRPHVGSNRLPRVLGALARAPRGRSASPTASRPPSPGCARRAGGCGPCLVDGGATSSPPTSWCWRSATRRAPIYALGGGVGARARAQAVRGGRAHRAPAAAHRRDPVRGGGRTPAAAPGVLRARDRRRAGRGVYSFCMCPGGWIVPAATEPDGVVVNGMSLSRRDSPFANAGFVVAVGDRRLADRSPTGRSAGVELQRRIERAAFGAGGGGFRAPAQRLGDFLAGRAGDLAAAPRATAPGLCPADLGAVLPPFIGEALRAGLRQHRRAPARLPPPGSGAGRRRDPDERARAPAARSPHAAVSPSLAGLYPCGEGAGYAGGIVSAALDGARVAERILTAP